MFDNWPCTVSTTYQEPDDGKSLTERLLDLMKKVPKRDKTVYRYPGNLKDLVKQLGEAGVEIRRDKYCRFTYDTITGLDLVEVPEYHCVLIGAWCDIIEVLDKKENTLAFLQVLERPEHWFQGRSACSGSAGES